MRESASALSAAAEAPSARAESLRASSAEKACGLEENAASRPNGFSPAVSGALRQETSARCASNAKRPGASAADESVRLARVHAQRRRHLALDRFEDRRTRGDGRRGPEFGRVLRQQQHGADLGGGQARRAAEELPAHPVAVRVERKAAADRDQFLQLGHLLGGGLVEPGALEGHRQVRGEHLHQLDGILLEPRAVRSAQAQGAERTVGHEQRHEGVAVAGRDIGVEENGLPPEGFEALLDQRIGAAPPRQRAAGMRRDEERLLRRLIVEEDAAVRAEVPAGQFEGLLRQGVRVGGFRQVPRQVEQRGGLVQEDAAALRVDGAEAGGDGALQGARLERQGYEIGGAAAHGLHGVADRPAGGHHHDAGVRIHLLEVRQELHAVHPRHGHLGQDEVGRRARASVRAPRRPTGPRARRNRPPSAPRCSAPRCPPHDPRPVFAKVRSCAPMPIWEAAA